MEKMKNCKKFKICQKLAKIEKIEKNWQKKVKNWSKMAKNGQKWQKMVKIENVDHGVFQENWLK